MRRSNINHELRKIDIEFRMLELEKRRHELERQLEEQLLEEQLLEQTTAAAKPSAAKPSAESIAVAKPSAESTAAAKPSAAKPSAAKPSAESIAAAKPSAAKPSAESTAQMPRSIETEFSFVESDFPVLGSAAKPAAAKPVAAKPVAAKPVAAKPTATAKSSAESIAKPVIGNETETNWANMMENEEDDDMTSEEHTSESQSAVPSSSSKMDPAPYVPKEFECWHGYECYNAACTRIHPDPRMASRCPYREKCLNMYWRKRNKDHKYVCRFNHTQEDIEKNDTAVVCTRFNCDTSKCIFVHLDSGYIHNHCPNGKHCPDLLHGRCNFSHSAWEKENIKENCRCVDGDKCPKYRNKNGNKCIWYH